MKRDAERIARRSPRGAGLPLAAFLIAALALAAWSNGFHGAFIFDDGPAIVDNPHLRRLLPLSFSMSAPAQTTAAGRPMLSLTLALNFAFGGLDVRGYHAFNLALHIINGWLMFVLVRMLARGRAAGEAGSRDEARANRIAFGTALLWTLHPIQTESVTYIVQRAESIMAFFYLVTLIASVRFLRGAGGVIPASVAVTACALGMASKEVMVVAPASVLLLDWIESRPRLAGLSAPPNDPPGLRARVLFHVALWFTIAILAGLMVSGPRDESAGFGFEGITPLGYAASQFGVITNYLRLVLWPQPLVLDYQWNPATGFLDILPPMLFVLGLLGVTIRGIVLRRRVSVPGALMFLLLAPTSTFVPIADLAFVHRMYLPLAAPVALFVLALDAALEALAARPVSGRAFCGRSAAFHLPIALAALTLATLTWKRNEAYRTEISIYSDVVAKRPLNYRSHNNLGSALLNAGRFAEAEHHLKLALAVKDDFPDAWYNLGNVKMDTGDLAGAARAFEEALARDPDHSRAMCNLGSVIAQGGDPARALDHFARSLELDPSNAEAYINQAIALLELGRREDAVRTLERCLARLPEYSPAAELLGELRGM